MSAETQAPTFDALDAAHRQIQDHLAQLAELVKHIQAHGLDAGAREAAGNIEAFFSGSSRQHHKEEEENVFPPLLASGNAELVAAVRSLQQDHGWIEENWIELSPRMRAIAEGNGWLDETEFVNYVEVFLELCNGHIALEETLIYPESKARWAKAVAARDARVKALTA
jgi:hemerythrin-like domain-containing protein